MRWLVALCVLFSDVVHASDPVPVKLVTCVLDGIPITLDGHPISLAGPRHIDLAPYAGKKIRITGNLTPGDRLFPTADIEVLGACTPSEKLELLHALADIYRRQGDATPATPAAAVKKRTAMDCPDHTCYRILRVPKAGGTATILRSAHLIGHIFVDKDNVYWSEGEIGSWQMMRLRKTGGTPTPIAKGELRGDMVRGPGGFYGYIDGGLFALADGKPNRLLVPMMVGSEVATDAATVYFSEYGPENSSAISAMPLAGGPKRPLAVGEPNSTALVVSDGQLYWANINVPPLGGGQIRRTPVDGGVVRTIVDTLPRMSPQAMAVDARHLYWVEHAAGGFELYRAPKDGGTRTLVAFAPAQFTHRDNRDRIELDATHVYWNAQETVARVAKAGGPVEDVVRLARGDVMSFAIDDKDVYVAVVIF